jgi:DNA (cytosine-5)-methyltransferase 1
MTLRMIDTFSGIGGFSLAARWLGGIETVQFVEREPFCHKILRKHWPGVPIHNDICTYEPAPGSADIVCGGFPCQDISTAGRHQERYPQRIVLRTHASRSLGGTAIRRHGERRSDHF